MKYLCTCPQPLTVVNLPLLSLIGYFPVKPRLLLLTMELLFVFYFNMAANGEVVDVNVDKETSGIMDETSGEGELQQTILSLESILSIVWYFYY